MIILDEKDEKRNCRKIDRLLVLGKIGGREYGAVPYSGEIPDGRNPNDQSVSNRR